MFLTKYISNYKHFFVYFNIDLYDILSIFSIPALISHISQRHTLLRDAVF